MATGPPQPVDRSKAWGCVVANLVLPGLGTWAAGRRTSGITQIVLSQGGFVLAMIWGVWCLNFWTRNRKLPDELGPYIFPAMIGVALFLLGWFWALASSFAILRRRDEHSPTGPATRT